MKVVSGETMQQMDQRTIREFGISGLTLMENAGRGCADAICDRFGAASGRRVLIVAGKGNNGGDGYVIARYLRERGWQATVLLLASPDQIRGDAATNLERLGGEGVIIAPEGVAAYAELFPSSDLVVDALLGTGVKSEVTGVYAEAIGAINAAGVPVVAVDLPSGVDANTGRVLGVAVKAELTVTFALAKLGNVQFPGAEHSGKLVIVDIGMPKQVVDAAPGGEFVDAAAAARLVRPRRKTAHKGSSGHTLIVAGSTGKTGAAAMAAASTVRTGGGLVTLAVPESVHPILEVKTTEAMTVPVGDHGRGHFTAGAFPFLENLAQGKDAVALGPGIGAARTTFFLVQRLVEALEVPMVIDADGLNALAAAPELLGKRQGRVTVLTPHPGEMARLTGGGVADVERDRIATAVGFSARYGVHTILKGAATVIAAPDGRYAVNGSGNPGMASGGMGDTLTGILVSLLGQGYPPFDACRLGVFLHGFAADLLAAQGCGVGMHATDVQEKIPLALSRLGG
ncbi:NAD(P)H-hydrate dehydratase [Geomesophilobacter sediminis]|uniref:Bifunctional NAD(P)H-hydrate repair enzyme n=1 Tax=Geomesophilobacter sediminis TaxID=2798584 RepID=A0A8J7J5N4_9BACT|nr:NAD(P)H-hydrate dehydratase [Geomesophilobacter sediminis]MBJ6726313.1 NAD(P)H-hydrate dehydratase [Geomesophilobacter sediminis]